MSRVRAKTPSKTAVLIIALLIIVAAFFLFGGSQWVKGIHVHSSIDINHWCWGQILISLIVGFALGWFICKKRR
jgi:uncharacterized protein YneF (UPF0154 family)